MSYAFLRRHSWRHAHIQLNEGAILSSRSQGLVYLLRKAEGQGSLQAALDLLLMLKVNRQILTLLASPAALRYYLAASASPVSTVVTVSGPMLMKVSLAKV